MRHLSPRTSQREQQSFASEHDQAVENHSGGWDSGRGNSIRGPGMPADVPGLQLPKASAAAPVLVACNQLSDGKGWSFQSSGCWLEFDTWRERQKERKQQALWDNDGRRNSGTDKRFSSSSKSVNKKHNLIFLSRRGPLVYSCAGFANVNGLSQSVVYQPNSRLMKLIILVII